MSPHTRAQFMNFRLNTLRARYSEEDRANLSASVNCTLLFLVLLGIYICTYVGTTCIYGKVSRTAAHKWVILITLTGLLLCVTGQACVQWYYTNVLLLDTENEEGQNSRSAILRKPILGFLTIMFIDFEYVLADSLLVWRCFEACGRSIRWTIVPFLLLVAECALAIVIVVLEGSLSDMVQQSSAYNYREKQFNILSGCLAGVTVITSVLGTFIIGYRVYSASTSPTRRRKYQHIIDVVVQSSAMYSITLLVIAICDFLDAYSSSRMFIVSDYVGTLTAFISAFSPTLMVARLAYLSNKNKDLASTQRSADLQFLDRSTVEEGC